MPKLVLAKLLAKLTLIDRNGWCVIRLPAFEIFVLVVLFLIPC
jgi:hypothetical protein